MKAILTLGRLVRHKKEVTDGGVYPKHTARRAMNSRDDCFLMAAANRIRTDDAEAARIGAMFAEVLNCKRDKEHKDRWRTDWGTKTDIGLARTILSALETEGEGYLKPKKGKL